MPGALPWLIRTDDLGLRVVDEIGHSCTIDDEWTIQTARGYEWWGKDLRTCVWSESGFHDDGFEVFRLHAQTDLLRDFDPTTENLERLNAVAALATTSAYLVDEEAGTVRLAASMYVHEETAFCFRRAFQLVTAMQAADAQIRAEVLATATGATVAATLHPASGPRTTQDDMLDLFRDVVTPYGARPCRWVGDEMERVWRAIRASPFTVLSLGGGSGFSAEFPFQSRTSLLQVLTGEAHPQVGNGVTLLLRLPMLVDRDDGLRLAAELTRREVTDATEAHLLGAWCWRRDGLVHVSFLPNVWHVFDTGDLFNIALAMAHRARWVAETFYGDDWEANLDAKGRPTATPSALDLWPELRQPPDDEDDT